jgi:transposase
MHVQTVAHIDGLELENEVHLTRTEMEERRMNAARELQKGTRRSMVARRCGVSRTTISRWTRDLTAAKGNLDALRARKSTGRPSRLGAKQMQAVVELWDSGMFHEIKWTTQKFAQALLAEFGVHYDPDHVGRIILRLGLREKRLHQQQPKPQV